MHVRRTDKVNSEAARHEVEEYMGHVEDWFRFREKLHPGPVERRVYLATDEPKVLEEARQK